MYVKIEDNQVIYPPHNFENMINVDLDENWLIANGYTDMSEEYINSFNHTSETSNSTSTLDTSEFDTSCEYFRGVCSQIGDLIHNPNFKGGFDEITLFSNSTEAQSTEGIMLGIKWISADKACTYYASKIGLGQPQWWYECWRNQ